MSEAIAFAGGIVSGSLLTGVLLWLTWLSSAAAINRRSFAPVAWGFVCRLAVLACAFVLATEVRTTGSFFVGAGIGLLTTRAAVIQAAMRTSSGWN